MPATADMKVSVKAPSRGLFTRWPSEDSQLEQGRAATVAENVRFEDGVVCNALGRSRIAIDSELDSALNLIYESNVVSAARPASNQTLFLGTEQKLFVAERTYRSEEGYRVALNDIASGLSPVADSASRWQAADFYDKVIFNQETIPPQYWDGTGLLKPLPGLPVGTFYKGVTVFYGRVILWNDTTMKWGAQNDYATFIPVASTINSLVLTVNGGFIQPNVGSTVSVPVDPIAGPLTTGQYVQLRYGDNFSTYSVTTNYYKGAAAIILRLESITGFHASGTSFPDNQQIFTVDANTAGELLNVGGQISGAIWQIITLGDTAFIFKNRSIQSVQYVGSPSVFFIRPEIADEGLIARNAFVRIGSNAGDNGGGRIVFLGLKELYEYRGGPQLTPVCQQFTRQLFSELDRGRLDEVVLCHKEDRNEIWVIYPATTDEQFRVLVWNYFENTATIDRYNAETGGICALGMASWQTDPSWDEAQGTWASQANLTWDAFVSTGVKRLMLMGNRGDVAATDTWEGLSESLTWEAAVGAWQDFTNPNTNLQLVPRLFVHGLDYSNDGAGYLSKYESFDFDFGDDAIFKYAHTVRLSLQISSSLPYPKRLFVQLGGRENLDSDIHWSASVFLDVRGNVQFPTKVNCRATGRFIRLRVYSIDAYVKWRLSSFTILARPGGKF